MSILILFAHPAFHKSKVNKLMTEGLSDIEGVTFRDLYQEYPELDIDVNKEQELMEAHDTIIFQFPLFWYSTPAILKEWQDLVLEHGWAFGSKGNALKGKKFILVVTAGGPRNAYKAGGFHNHTLPQLLSPLRQTASLCKMINLPPFVVSGSHAIEAHEVQNYKKEFLMLLDKLLKDEIDPDETDSYEYLNDYLSNQN